MLTKRELEEAIKECEDAPVSFDNAHKLATLYNLYDRQYSRKEYPVADVYDEEVIGDNGDTEFLQMIKGLNAYDVWQVMNELIEALEIINPRLYDGVIRRIKGSRY